MVRSGVVPTHSVFERLSGATSLLCGRRRAAKESTELFACDFVAFARRVLEPGAVEDTDLAVRVADKSRLSERRGSDRHAGSAGAEHHREIFMGERNLIKIDTIVRHEEPTRTTLVNAVQAIAGRQLSEHVHIRL